MTEKTEAEKHGVVGAFLKIVVCCSWLVLIPYPVGAIGMVEGSSFGPLYFFASSDVSGLCLRTGKECIFNQTIDKECARTNKEKLSLPFCKEPELPPRSFSSGRGFMMTRSPSIIAPKPYVYDTVNGRKVCNKKNDKPSKSKKYKHIHMDMECCLDPDEIPNPHCYYDPGKYRELLEKRR